VLLVKDRVFLITKVATVENKFLIDVKGIESPVTMLFTLVGPDGHKTVIYKFVSLGHPEEFDEIRRSVRV